jgi:hypothetical protein
VISGVISRSCIVSNMRNAMQLQPRGPTQAGKAEMSIILVPLMEQRLESSQEPNEVQLLGPP